jgi:hypothetical protein
MVFSITCPVLIARVLDAGLLVRGSGVQIVVESVRVIAFVEGRDEVRFCFVFANPLRSAILFNEQLVYANCRSNLCVVFPRAMALPTLALQPCRLLD